MALVPRQTDSTLLMLFEQSVRNAHRGATMLRDLLRDFPERSELAATLKDVEHEGDRLTRDIIHLVRCGTVAGPIDAADGHALATGIDDIVDFTEQTADWLVLYAVEAPMETATRLAGVLVEATGSLIDAMTGLEDRADLSPALENVGRLEDEGDLIYRAGVAALFERGIDPMVVIRWKDIFLALESAIDACESVAHVLSGIALKLTR